MSELEFQNRHYYSTPANSEISLVTVIIQFRRIGRSVMSATVIEQGRAIRALSTRQPSSFQVFAQHLALF